MCPVDCAARLRAALLSQSDILMPVMDGVELLSRIKADERLAPLPVLLCTGYEDDRLAAVCHKVGAEAVVRKPVDLNTIEELVRGRGRQTDDGTGLGPENELDGGAVSPHGHVGSGIAG